MASVETSRTSETPEPEGLDLPWHRVITASGRPARHLTTRQLELLRAEGILARDGKVPLDEVRHRFPG